MKTSYQTMKNILNVNIWSALLLTTTLFAACSTEDTKFEKDIIKERMEQMAGETDEVMKLLATVPGVTDIQKTLDGDSLVAYNFNFSQKANHMKDDSYTFKQAGTLHYVGPDAPVVLITQGYTLSSTSSYRANDLVTYLQANAIEMEYRYFGTSQPEAGEDLAYNYLSTEQAAYDLHEVVTAFKQTMFKNNQWVASGTSKGGINAALYAYYSDLKGWNDMDLYMPFCAPFLVGTDDNPEDGSTGLYVEYNCGNGYEAGTEEAKAFDRLQKLPLAIADNAAIRKLCTQELSIGNSDFYLRVLRNFNAKNEYTTGNLEKDMTIVVLDLYYTNLFQKFSYIPFSYWAEHVPDPDTAMADEASSVKLLKFIFQDFESFYQNLFTNTTRGDGVSNELGKFLNELHADKTSTYQIQAIMQLGVARNQYTLLSTSSYLTLDEIEKVRPVSSTYYQMKKVAEENYLFWDGGKTMSDFRAWVVKQTTMPMLFIYGMNDPWTGGRIDTPLPTSKTQVIYNPGGTHSNDILHQGYYYSSKEILAAIDKILGR